jgi:hypothetical protein
MKEYHILNLGAGVQSTTLYLLSLRGEEGIPKFDCAIFADTQEEPKAVYDHLEWLKSLNGPPILIGTAGSLGRNLIAGRNLTGKSFCSIPTYLSESSATLDGLGRRQCTRDYKIDVIERMIRRDILGLAPRQRIPKDVTIHQYLGLSYDEPGRIIKVQGRYASKAGFEPHFPLWDLQWNRSDCEAYLREVAPDRKVAKSACVFCPYHDNATWRDIRDNDPEGWQRAIEIDEAIRRPTSICAQNLDMKQYIHRSCVPLSEAKIDEKETRQLRFGFANECEGMCGL